MKRIALGLLLGISIAALVGVSWSAGYEGSPAGTDLASDLDTFIQSFKAEVRQRAEVEHIWGAGGDDNGLHTMGSARCFVQNAAPTDINSGTAALGQYNSAASADAGTALTTDEVGAVTRDIGAGRCWVDLDGADGVAGTLDDEQLNVWNESSNAWVPVRAQTITGIGVATGNLIYNGSFEITDGTGATASTTVPAGWALSAPNPTITYQDPTGVGEGEGLAVNVTGTGANGSITQTLSSLKASTTYVIRARANPTTAGDSCILRASDGTSNVTDTSAVGSGVYETMEVSITTTAVPADVVVALETVALTDVCRWDEVTAYERNSTVATPGIQVCYSTDTTTTNNAYTAGAWADALVSCAVTAPGPGYIIRVSGQMVGDNENGNDQALAGRLRESGSTVAMSSAVAKAQATGGADNFQDLAVVHVEYVKVQPTPGTTYTYTIEGRATAATFDRNLGDDGNADVDGVSGPFTQLEVELIPTR